MIDKLQFFLVLAREQNFRRAAEVCGVAQPTLSAAIKSLEDMLGVMLVRRSSRTQGLTPEGERVLEWARRLVGDARAMRAEVRAFSHGLTGAVRLAVIPSALPYAPTLTRRFQARHPGVGVAVLSRSSDEMLAQLDDLEVDAGITYLGNETIGRLRALPLYTERYKLLTGSASPLAGRRSVTWAEVADLRLCLLTPGMQNRRIIDRLLGPSSADRAGCMLEADSMLALLAHVRHGDWSTVVSEAVADLVADAPAFRAVPIEGAEAAFLVGLVVADRQPMAPILRALMDVAAQPAASQDAVIG